MNKPAIYFKMCVKSMLSHPGPGTLYSCLKYYLAWRRHLTPGRNSVSDMQPWMCFSAIDFLKKISRPDMLVFEYGSGGSTLFWTSRVLWVVSVEHDKPWFDKMQEEVLRQQIKNIDYILAGPEQDPAFEKKDFRDPGSYISNDKSYSRKNFETYVKMIDKYPDAHFDIIIIDGRARPSCIQHAIGKLKKGGYLVIDNTEREYYLAPFKFDKAGWETLNFMGPVPYIYHFSNTTILKKSSSLTQTDKT